MINGGVVVAETEAVSESLAAGHDIIARSNLQLGKTRDSKRQYYVS